MTHFVGHFKTASRFQIRGIAAGRQRGAALFTALMMLIILSILGVAAARVTALQERMAGIYLADVRAFEAAEDRVRDNERLVLSLGPDEACGNPPIANNGVPSDWIDGSNIPPESNLENLNNPRSAASRGMGVGNSRQGQSMVPGGEGCLFFRVGALDYNGADRTAVAVVQSIYIP